MTSTNGASSSSSTRLAERLEELLAAERRREHLVVQVDLGQAGDRAEQHVLDARLAGRRDRDRVAVAAHALRDPEDVDLLDARRRSVQPPCRAPSVRRHRRSSSSSASTSSSSPRSSSRSRPPQAAQRSGKPASSLSRPARAGSARPPGPPPSPARRPRRACPAPPARRRTRAPTGTTWRRCPTFSSTARPAARRRACTRSATTDVGDRELVHQQILGSGSPTSWSITRRPPNAVSTSTMPGRLGPDLADLGRVLAARHRAQRGERRVGRLGRDERDELALVGDVHRVDARAAPPRRRPPGAPARRPRARSSPRREARASSLSTEATPPRVASRRQRSCRAGGVEQRVDRRPQRARVGLDRRRRARTRRGRA